MEREEERVEGRGETTRKKGEENEGRKWKGEKGGGRERREEDRREGGRGKGSNNWQHHSLKKLQCKDGAVTMLEAVQAVPR